jgi:hypothetical protein
MRDRWFLATDEALDMYGEESGKRMIQRLFDDGKVPPNLCFGDAFRMITRTPVIFGTQSLKEPKKKNC